MKIKRVHKRDKLGELISLAVFSLGIPQGLAHEVDALSTFAGLGEDIRVIQPTRKYWEHKNTKNRFFLIAGHNKAEETWSLLSEKTLAQKPFSIKKFDGVHIKTHCKITPDQAKWTIKKIKELGITSCGVVATPFFLLRAYITTIQEMHNANIKIPIIPIPVFVSPKSAVPESKISAWDMMQGEIERIHAYQGKEDLISYKDFREYIDWLWDQPIIKKFL